MYTFSILLLPIALAFYYLASEKKESLILIITGVLTGVLTCAIKAFFTFSHRLVKYDFASNFVYFLLRESLLPSLILFLVFFLVSKDTLEYKFKAFFPLICAFYAVFLPHAIISSSEAKSVYEIFIKPAVYLSMLACVSSALLEINKGITEEKRFIATGSLAAIVCLAMPALIESVWIISSPVYVWIPLVSVFLALPIVLYAVRRFNQSARKTDKA